MSSRKRPQGLVAAAAIAVVCAGAASPARSAPVEPKWLAAAEAAQRAVVASLKDMVLIESGSANAAGLAKMADYIERRLQALGARTERIPAGRPPGVLVQGSFSGTGTKKLMLIAHMDTVYPEGTLTSEPSGRTATSSTVPGSPTTKAASPSSCIRSRS